MTDTMPVSRIIVGERYRKDLGDLPALARSIADLGLLQPVVVNSTGQLIAGQRRLEACKLLGWTKIPVRVIYLDNMLQAEHDENVVREDFTYSERLAIADAIAERIGNRQGQRTDQEELPLNGAEVPVGQETREAAAKKAGFRSKDEYRRVKAVEANGCDELVEALDAGEVSPSAAAEVATLPKEEQREVLSSGPEAVAEKAKRIREERPAKSSPTPRSDRLKRWLRAVSGETNVIQVELGGITSFLEGYPNGWDKMDVKNYILPMLEALKDTIETFTREIKSAYRKK